MSASGVCMHCGLPAPAAADAAESFCCLGCRIAYSISGAGGDEGAARWVMARFLLAALFAVAVMTLSLILYSEEVFDADLERQPLGQLLRWAVLALSTPVILLLAPALVDPSRRGVRRWANLDVWILTAVIAAWSLSAWRVIAGSGRVYFESAAMVLVLVTLGRYLEARAKVRIGDAATKLRALVPERARIIAATVAEWTPVAQVVPGTLVRVLAGERVPVDGTVQQGAGHLDRSVLTGEHEPETTAVGQRVEAGMLLLDGAVDINSEAVVGERRVDRIAKAVESARQQRTPAMRVADTLAAWMLPLVFAIGAAVLLHHGLGGDWETGLIRGLSVLLVSCPCALGLATPLATSSAIAGALEEGVLVRDASSFERLARIRRVLFDKTGTLTTGSKTLSAAQTHVAAQSIAARIAAASNHPASRALASDQVSELPEDIAIHAGRGVEATVDAHRYRLGSQLFLSELSPLSATVTRNWDAIESTGRSAVGLREMESGETSVFALEEELRAGARAAVGELRAAGFELAVLTGDAESAAQKLGSDLGLAVHARLSPEEKSEHVSASRDPAVFVGDGVNDALALTRADVSVSLESGTDLAQTAAAVVLLRNDLSSLPALFDLARRTVGRIRFNLFWALVYNPLFLFLAATGRLAPVWCALAMAASSLLVAGLAAARPLRADARDHAGQEPIVEPAT